METSTFDKYPFLKELGLQQDNIGCYDGKTWEASGEWVTSYSPTDNKPIARVRWGVEADYDRCLQNMEAAKKEWMGLSMVKRGEVVAALGAKFKERKEALGRLVTLEMGKILSEGLGEVQEVIDICDYAVGLSRTLAGKTLASERDEHELLEKWNPLGLIGIITAFNFPVAVCGWNSAISFVCGNASIWKGAPTTNLISVATTKIFQEVLESFNLNGVFTLCCGDGPTIGERMINDTRLSLISFTGSTAVGRHVSTVVHSKFGRTILELGGNSSTIVLPDADQEMALKAVLFGAVGTAGQRCTSLRRLILHEDIYDEFVAKLKKVYPSIKIGSPFDESTICGPLHTKQGLTMYEEGIKKIVEQGGKVAYGNKLANVGELAEGNFVTPTIIEVADPFAEFLKHELFCPVLFVLKCSSLDDAIKINNSVPQGLSSSLFSKNMQNVFKWIGPNGSDCGLVNVNVGTSGAEIGGAFGGEKETGGGRESGGEAWRQYMRQSTCTINYGNSMPLSQGVKFDL